MRNFHLYFLKIYQNLLFVKAFFLLEFIVLSKIIQFFIHSLIINLMLFLALLLINPQHFLYLTFNAFIQIPKIFYPQIHY